MKIRIATQGVFGAGALGAAAAIHHEFDLSPQDQPSVAIVFDNGSILRLANMDTDGLSLTAQGADLLLLTNVLPLRVLLATYTTAYDPEGIVCGIVAPVQTSDDTNR